jgi:hypothetical protein
VALLYQNSERMAELLSKCVVVDPPRNEKK